MRSLTRFVFAFTVSSGGLAFAADQLARTRNPASGCCTLLIAGVIFWLLKRTEIPTWLAAGIAIFPLGFAWVTLKDEYRAARTIAFAYLLIPICFVGAVGGYAGFLAVRGARDAEAAASRFPTMLKDRCVATGSFTLEECSCMEREARASNARWAEEDDVDRAWLNATAQKCAPTANADPLGPPAPDRHVGVVTAKVSSLPEGAEIVVDGKRSGKKTPAELELLADTKAVVEVRLQGYLPQQREVRYRVGDPAELTFKLDAAATLSVKTEPPGARVLLDERPVIAQTPAEAPGLEPRTARVAIQRDGHATVVREVTLEPGKTASLDETLVPAAFITVISTPDGATVEIDGVAMPEKTPTPVPVLPDAKHAVVVSLPGRTPVKKSIKSGAAGSTSTFSVSLVDAKLQALTRTRDAADKALKKVEAALERARDKHDDAEARGAVTARLVKALEQAEDAFNRAEDRANEATAALDAYREAQEKDRLRPSGAPRP